MNKVIYIDIETTGLTEKHGLIQLSGIIVIDDEVKEEFDFRVQPFKCDLISSQALEVTGVKQEDLDKAPYEPPAVVHSRFLELLGRYVDKFDKTDKFFFIGYNAAFDMQKLREFFQKNNDNYIGSWFWFPYIDVMTLAAQKLKSERHKMDNFKLFTVARKLGLEVDESKLHNSMYDIELTKEVYSRVR